MPATHWPKSISARHPCLALLAAVALVVVVTGCTTFSVNNEVPDIARGYTPHMQQVLDNLARFTKDPNAWPSHVLVYKGTFERRGQWTGAVGTSTKLEKINYSLTRWELSYLDDPYDIQRVCLLYQWQVGHIEFDQLEHEWNEIRDRAVLDGSGKPVLGSDGRPTCLALPLPITRNTKRDWTTDRVFDPHSELAGYSGTPGVPGTLTLWVTDTKGATQFCRAILIAMANTRVRARWGDAAMMTP